MSIGMVTPIRATRDDFSLDASFREMAERTKTIFNNIEANDVPGSLCERERELCREEEVTELLRRQVASKLRSPPRIEREQGMSKSLHSQPREGIISPNAERLREEAWTVAYPTVVPTDPHSRRLERGTPYHYSQRGLPPSTEYGFSSPRASDYASPSVHPPGPMSAVFHQTNTTAPFMHPPRNIENESLETAYTAPAAARQRLVNRAMQAEALYGSFLPQDEYVNSVGRVSAYNVPNNGYSLSALAPEPTKPPVWKQQRKRRHRGHHSSSRHRSRHHSTPLSFSRNSTSSSTSSSSQRQSSKHSSPSRGVTTGTQTLGGETQPDANATRIAAQRCSPRRENLRDPPENVFSRTNSPSESNVRHLPVNTYNSPRGTNTYLDLLYRTPFPFAGTGNWRTEPLPPFPPSLPLLSSPRYASPLPVAPPLLRSNAPVIAPPPEELPSNTPTANTNLRAGTERVSLVNSVPRGREQGAASVRPTSPPNEDQSTVSASSHDKTVTSGSRDISRDTSGAREPVSPTPAEEEKKCKKCCCAPFRLCKGFFKKISCCKKDEAEENKKK